MPGDGRSRAEAERRDRGTGEVWRAEEPPPPPAAAEVFGPALGTARQYARWLTGPGIERGLIGPAEAARIWDRHLLNGAAVAELVPGAGVLADLGSGAGLPGMVLAMVRPAMRVILVEPMLRRTTFLEQCAADLALANVTVLRGRAEELSGRIGADVVTARAVAPLERLAGLALGLIRPGGVILAVKGSGAAAEIEAAGPILERLGLTEIELVRCGDGYLDPPVTVIRLRAGGGDAGSSRAARLSRRHAKGTAGRGRDQVVVIDRVTGEHR